MQDIFSFHPARSLGVIFHLVTILLVSAAGIYSLWQSTLASMGPSFLLYLFPSLLAIAVVPMLAYRALALQNAYYTLERDGIRLRWGLRQEDIPIDTVQWVHPVADLEISLPLPWLRWPGSVLGVRRLTGAGNVEFMASNTRRLLLIATTGRYYAISPADPTAFLHTFQRFTEMGSLSPLPPRSIHPSFLLDQVWASRPARLLLISGLLLSLALLVWVSLAIPTHTYIPLGFYSDGSPGDLIASIQLLLLPVVSIFFFLADSLLGLFFFRRTESQPIAYLLWGSGAFTPLLFLVAVYFILHAA